MFPQVGADHDTEAVLTDYVLLDTLHARQTPLLARCSCLAFFHSSGRSCIVLLGCIGLILALASLGSVRRSFDLLLLFDDVLEILQFDFEEEDYWLSWFWLSELK